MVLLWACLLPPFYFITFVYLWGCSSFLSTASHFSLFCGAGFKVPGWKSELGLNTPIVGQKGRTHLGTLDFSNRRPPSFILFQNPTSPKGPSRGPQRRSQLNFHAGNRLSSAVHCLSKSLPSRTRRNAAQILHDRDTLSTAVLKSAYRPNYVLF